MTKSFDFDLEILKSKSNDSILLKSHDKILRVRLPRLILLLGLF